MYRPRQLTTAARLLFASALMMLVACAVAAPTGRVRLRW